MYQQLFMATPQYKYYTKMLDNLIRINNCNGEPLSNEKLWQAVSDVREETDAEHKRNINEITCDTSFQSPMQNKDVSTISDYVYYESDEQVGTISYYNKQVDPKAETHIVDRIRKLSVRLFNPAVIGFIGKDLVMNFLDNSRVELSLNNFYPLNPNTSKAIMIGSACKSAKVYRNTLIRSTLHDNHMRNHIMIGTPAVNEGVFRPIRGKISSFAK